MLLDMILQVHVFPLRKMATVFLEPPAQRRNDKFKLMQRVLYDKVSDIYFNIESKNRVHFCTFGPLLF